jgi:hypothetical protein
MYNPGTYLKETERTFWQRL